MQGGAELKGETHGDDADLENSKPFPWQFRIEVQEQILPQANPNCYQRKAGDFSWRSINRNESWLQGVWCCKSSPANRSQRGQVCLTLPWALSNRMGTETPFGNDPEDEKSLLARNMSPKALPAPSVLARQNFAIRQQENLKLYPNSLVFQQGAQVARAFLPLS